MGCLAITCVIMISRVILILRIHSYTYIKILPSIAQSETKMEKVVPAIRSALSFCALPDGSLEKALHSSTRIINIFQESWIRRIKFPKHSIYKLKKHLFIQSSIIFFCPSTQALTVFRCNEYPDLFPNILLSVRKTYIQEIYSLRFSEHLLCATSGSVLIMYCIWVRVVLSVVCVLRVRYFLFCYIKLRAV